MIKLLLIALAICLVPSPAYATGFDIPAGLVFGTFWTLVVAIGAACSLKGNFAQRLYYFAVALAGSAFCAILLMAVIAVLVNERGLKEGKFMYQMLVASASILAGFVAPVFAQSLIQREKILAKRSNKFLLAGWVALSLIAVGAPYFYGLSVTGYGQTFFAGTVAPFVSALVLAIAAILGLVNKVNIKTDYVFRRIFLYWPFATLFGMLLCDTHRVMQQMYLQEIIWIPFLIGYPVSAIVFTVRRMKARDKGQNNPP